MSPSDLRIPKHSLAVELAVRGRPPSRAELFLAEHREHTWAPQEILDLLEGADAFLPIRDLEGQALRLVNKQVLRWVALDLGAEIETLFEERRAVRLTFLEGEDLDGHLLYTAPTGRARVQDLLNAPGRFFRMWRNERVYLVQKSHVLELHESESR